MSIQPVKTEGVAQPIKAKAQPPGSQSAASEAPATDRVEIESQEHLLEAVRQEPAVRPEVVDRAQQLASDPNYPSKEVLERVARRLLGGK